MQEEYKNEGRYLHPLNGKQKLKEVKRWVAPKSKMAKYFLLEGKSKFHNRFDFKYEEKLGKLFQYFLYSKLNLQEYKKNIK